MLSSSKVNNATARVQTKKPAATALPNAAALRGAALQRGRVRALPTAAAAPFARHPAPMTAAAAASALHGYTPLYYDPAMMANSAMAAQLQVTPRSPPLCNTHSEVCM
ncbi:hypothetical protein FJT64_020792 [Amphibalanus amphitrite]|uniref:Uncharacterized protein n=1 Tax=Amphibalanus amphitrite TaxID=1232801 RepID=A0A6A4WKL3_AMPAM|nr:hypothetical protein FJT64_020792 [Amphibalanus amphitrite]